MEENENEEVVVVETIDNEIELSQEMANELSNGKEENEPEEGEE